MASRAPAPSQNSEPTRLDAIRRAVGWVAVLNLGYFFVEFVVARRIGSVSLFADSIDFLEDATINGLILVALGWTAVRRSRVGMFLAGILLVPGIATLWTAWGKLADPVVPHPVSLGVAGAGALAVNLFCALHLARFRTEGGSLMRAAFLSARNDALSNVGIIAAGVVTAATGSLWPDLVVGLAIFAMNLDAAREVYRAARHEQDSAGSLPEPPIFQR